LLKEILCKHINLAVNLMMNGGGKSDFKVCFKQSKNEEDNFNIFAFIMQLNKFEFLLNQGKS
jgi:hypothetical protein